MAELQTPLSAVLAGETEAEAELRRVREAIGEVKRLLTKVERPMCDSCLTNRDVVVELRFPNRLIGGVLTVCGVCLKEAVRRIAIQPQPAPPVV